MTVWNNCSLSLSEGGSKTAEESEAASLGSLWPAGRLQKASDKALPQTVTSQMLVKSKGLALLIARPAASGSWLLAAAHSTCSLGQPWLPLSPSR